MSEYRWLNESSKLFLERDYLLKGQTVDERVDIICNTAERLLNKPGYAKRLKDNFKKGWYSFSTPIWTNFGTDRGLPISCVVGDTKIAVEKGYKLAKDIQIGDEVETHSGYSRKVSNVIVTHNRNNIYCLTVNGNKLYATEDHLILTDFGWIRVDELEISNHRVATFPSIKFGNCAYDWSRIESVEKTERVETVYDFTVDIDHSFIANGIVVHNCFGSIISDDMESIAYTDAEVCMMTKHGGGTSAYFGNLRPRGTPIKNNGHSSGSVHFMQKFDNLINVISQGSCYIEGTEVLTDSGFKDFRNVIPDDKLAQVDKHNNITFTDDYKKIVEAFEGELYCYNADNVSLQVTPEHRMVVEELIDGGWVSKTIKAVDLNLTDKHRFVTLNTEDKFGYVSESETYEHFNYYKIGYVGGDAVKTTHEYYKGKVYCASVPEGRLVVRYQGNVIICGNSRRGNFAAYLPIDHGDILEFLQIKTEGHPIQHLSYGVCVPDYWMHEMIEGDRKKREIWAKVIETRYNTGFPYIFFTDNANNNTVDCYKDKGMKISHSNLCVTGDQLVVTNKGMKRVIDLYKSGEELVLFDGQKPVNASPMKLIEKNVDVYRITLANGMTHKVTGYHKVKTKRGMVACENLTIKDVIYVQSETGLFGDVDKQEEAKKLALQHRLGVFDINTVENIVVPEWLLEGNKATVTTYVRTLFKDNDFFTHYDKKLLEAIQTLMCNVGMHSFLGETKYGYYVLCKINLKKCYSIRSIAYAGKEDVYCPTVDSDEHLWVCNSFATSNCNEINLPDSEDESFVCDLSNMNVLYYDEWKDTDAVEILTYLLDAVMTEFIDKASKIRFMERAVKFAERHRALGLGWLGWHSLLQSKMIAWESPEAEQLNVEIAKNIKESSYKASAKLAQEYGEPEVCKGYGRRNTTLTAIPPAKSSSFILGQVSEGIEPHRTNHYIKDLQKGKFTIKNIYLEQVLREKGKDTDEVWLDILKHGGSVQHLSFLGQHEKNVFKTFAEISPFSIVTQTAERQSYIDQGQSLNLMIHPSIPAKETNRLMIEAWKMQVRGLYYQISVNAAQNFSRSLSCKSCEG